MCFGIYELTAFYQLFKMHHCQHLNNFRETPCQTFPYTSLFKWCLAVVRETSASYSVVLIYFSCISFSRCLVEQFIREFFSSVIRPYRKEWSMCKLEPEGKEKVMEQQGQGQSEERDWLSGNLKYIALVPRWLSERESKSCSLRSRSQN